MKVAVKPSKSSAVGASRSEGGAEWVGRGSGCPLGSAKGAVPLPRIFYIIFYLEITYFGGF